MLVNDDLSEVLSCMNLDVVDAHLSCQSISLRFSQLALKKSWASSFLQSSNVKPNIMSSRDIRACHRLAHTKLEKAKKNGIFAWDISSSWNSYYEKTAHSLRWMMFTFLRLTGPWRSNGDACFCAKNFILSFPPSPLCQRAQVHCQNSQTSTKRDDDDEEKQAQLARATLTVINSLTFAVLLSTFMSRAWRQLGIARVKE